MPSFTEVKPKSKPKAKPKKPWIESLIGHDVVLIDKHADKIKLENGMVFRLNEVDSVNRLYVVTKDNIELAFNFDMVKVVVKHEGELSVV